MASLLFCSAGKTGHALDFEAENRLLLISMHWGCSNWSPFLMYGKLTARCWKTRTVMLIYVIFSLLEFKNFEKQTSLQYSEAKTSSGAQNGFSTSFRSTLVYLYGSKIYTFRDFWQPTTPLSRRLQANAWSRTEYNPHIFRRLFCRVYFNAKPKSMRHIHDLHFCPVFGSKFHASDKNSLFCEEMKAEQRMEKKEYSSVCAAKLLGDHQLLKTWNNLPPVDPTNYRGRRRTSRYNISRHLNLTKVQNY